MALGCLKEGCRGRITTGRPGRQKYWEGDEYTCPMCGAQYMIGVTDDYEDDAIAYLIDKASGVTTSGVIPKEPVPAENP